MLGARMLQAAAPVDDQSYRDLIMSDGPVAYWRLDGESGSTAVDEMGNHDGTYNGDPTLGASSLIQSGTSAQFDGSDDYVDMGRPTEFTASYLGSTLTVEVWAYLDDVSTDQYLVSSGSGSGNDNFVIAVMSDAALRFYVDSSNGQAWEDSGFVVETGKTYHMVMTYDGSAVRGYVNGNLVYENSADVGGDLVAADGNLCVGSRNGDDRFTTGRIDEPAIYDRALTAAEIEEHYNKGVGA